MEKAEGSDQGSEAEYGRAALSVERAAPGREEQNEKLAALAAEYLDTATRVQAEFENFKRRTKREREELVKSANHQLLVRAARGVRRSRASPDRQMLR